MKAYPRQCFVPAQYGVPAWQSVGVTDMLYDSSPKRILLATAQDRPHGGRTRQGKRGPQYLARRSVAQSSAMVKRGDGRSAAAKPESLPAAEERGGVWQPKLRVGMLFLNLRSQELAKAMRAASLKNFSETLLAAGDVMTNEGVSVKSPLLAPY